MYKIEFIESFEQEVQTIEYNSFKLISIEEMQKITAFLDNLDQNILLTPFIIGPKETVELYYLELGIEQSTNNRLHHYKRPNGMSKQTNEKFFHTVEYDPNDSKYLKKVVRRYLKNLTKYQPEFDGINVHGEIYVRLL